MVCIIHHRATDIRFDATRNLRMHRSRRGGVQSSPARGPCHSFRVIVSVFDYFILAFFKHRHQEKQITKA
jgi:hypothetical protein